MRKSERPRRADRAISCASWPQHHRDDIEARWPKVLRRVAGYNLDIFDNQSVRPYTRDGSVNLAHLLVGSEGTLAFHQRPDPEAVAAAAGARAGGGEFPDLPRRDGCRPAHRQARSQRGGAGGPHHDRTEPVQSGISAPPSRRALIGRPDAILLVEFSGDDKAVLIRQLKDLTALMGDLGLPGSVVEMPDETPQKNLWEVRKAGLNIMMSLKGDGKPVSFIEDCAVPLEHLAEYTAALTEVFARHGTHGTWYAHASVGTLHVRPILDMRRDGAAQMRAIAEEAGALVRKYKGAFSGEHGDGLCRGEWIAWQFGPALNDAFRAIKRRWTRSACSIPARSSIRRSMDDVSLFRFPPPEAAQPYTIQPLQTALDWSDWDVQSDPVTEKILCPAAAAIRRRLRQGGGDVQQQRPLPQIRRRHHVPQLSRDAR